MTTTNKPTSNAEDREDAHHLPWTVLDRLVAQFDETRENAARAEALGNLDPRLSPWVELEISAKIDAQYQLTRAIIATNPDFAHHLVIDCERFRWPMRGVRSGNRIFLTFPDPGRDGEPGGHDCPPMMLLVAFELSAVLDSTVTSRFAEVVPGPIEPPAPVEPSHPGWLDMIHWAMDTLGESESRWRITGVRSTQGESSPFWREIVVTLAKRLGKDEALRRMFQAPAKSRVSAM